MSSSPLSLRALLHVQVGEDTRRCIRRRRPGPCGPCVTRVQDDRRYFLSSTEEAEAEITDAADAVADGDTSTSSTQLSLAGASPPPPRALDLSTPLQPRSRGLPSRELVELVRVQLDMLTTMLESRIAEEFSESTLGVRCAMYCRSEPAAAGVVSTRADRTDRTNTNSLHLQLVAASGGDGSFVCDPDDESSSITASAEMEQSWTNEATMVVLPDNGGLMLPLTHKNFLVGLLLVERVVGDGSTPSAYYIPPPVQDLFGPTEMAVIKQSAQALSMSCAMELRAIVDAAQQRMQQERLQGLLSQASKPLTTLKTLGRMLQPRLAEGEPERDMTDGVVAQGQYLSELLGQIQKAVGSGGGGGEGAWRLPAGEEEEEGRGSKNRKVVVVGGGVEGKAGGKKDAGRSKYAYALPSSSIGSDNATVTWDVESSSDEEEEKSEVEHNVDEVDDDDKGSVEVTSTSTLPSTDVCELLRRLLDSSAAFLATKGVSLVVEPGGILNETAPCVVRGEYAVVKHVLGTILDEAVDATATAASAMKDDDFPSIESRFARHVSLAVRVTKERGSVVLDVSLACDGDRADCDAWIDTGVRSVVGLDTEALADDVDELGALLLRDASGSSRLCLRLADE